MCQLASFIVTKSQVFWSKFSDSHEDIIEEFGLKEMNVRQEPTFVRVEITPPNNDYSIPITDWQYKLDQDIRPGWYDLDGVERRCRDALKEWHKQKITVNDDSNKKLVSGNFIVINSTVTVKDNSTVTAKGNSTVTALDNSTVTAKDNSTVTAWGNSTVTAWDNSTVTARGNSTVTARDNSTVEALDNSTVTARDNSTVQIFTKKRDDITVVDSAVLINRSGNKPKCVTAWRGTL